MQEQNQRTSPWLIAWRVIFTFALIGCIVFIFSNSLQIADVSEGASGRVLGILQGILRHLGLPGAADRLTMHIVRKLAHFCEYLLTDYEVENLRTAYERTLKVGSSSQSKMSQQDYELYGTYIPFSMAICHTINHKSGVDHTTYAHTGAMVNLYARGQGADKFRGVYDNTEIFHKLAELTDVQ